MLAGFLTAFLRSDTRATPRLRERPITINRTLSATAVLFGDRLDAEIDVYTDDNSIEPGSVRVRPDFRPYRAVSTKVDRTSRNGVSLLRLRTSLVCLTKACIPPREGGRVIRFRPFTVTYRAGGQDAGGQVPWGPIQELSRLPVDSTARVGVVDTPPPLDPGFARSPTLLRTALIVAAAVLGVAGALLVVTAIWPPSFSSRYRRRRLSPLEQSLREVEAAARLGDEAQRRRALDQLATHLAELPSPSLEARTRSLAWGAPMPDPEGLTLLTEQVRTSLNGGARR